MQKDGINKILIVGLGSIGKRHLRVARELRPELQIVVLRSTHDNKIPEENLANKIVYTMEDALTEHPQAAIIASPAPFHRSVAETCISNGIHLLVEKPVTSNLADARKILAVQNQAGVQALVGYCLRYDPNAVLFKQILDQKTIGNLLQVSIECGSFLPIWRPGSNYRNSVSSRRDLGGGVLLELSHELDYARWFFGDIVSVYAQFKNSRTLDIDVEDQADIVLTTADNIILSMHLDFNTHSSRRFCIVRGSGGDLKWNAIQKKVTLNLVNKPEQEFGVAYERDDVYKRQFTHFLDCVENGQAPRVTMKDGVNVVKIIEAAQESNSTGKRILLA